MSQPRVQEKHGALKGRKPGPAEKQRVPSSHGTCGMKPGLLYVLTCKSLFPVSAPVCTSLGLS